MVFILLGLVAFGYQKYNEEQKVALDVGEKLSDIETKQVVDVQEVKVRRSRTSELYVSRKLLVCCLLS